jgi:hypothetical protein
MNSLEISQNSLKGINNIPNNVSNGGATSNPSISAPQRGAAQLVTRRSRLPHPMVGNEGQLANFLRNNIGKVRNVAALQTLVDSIYRTYQRSPSLYRSMSLLVYFKGDQVASTDAASAAHPSLPDKPRIWNMRTFWSGPLPPRIP